MLTSMDKHFSFHILIGADKQSDSSYQLSLISELGFTFLVFIQMIMPLLFRLPNIVTWLARSEGKGLIII